MPQSQYEAPSQPSKIDAMASRKTYAGLKTMPPGSYQKVKMIKPSLGRLMTHFICKHPGCDRIFVKSTSLIVHYWRHVNLRPFSCNLCQTSFTQSGTLSRHNRAVHGVHSTVSLKPEEVN